jgi:GNAT superfamily N-acetyltransferase
MLIRVANTDDAVQLLPLIRQLGYHELDVAGMKEKIQLYSGVDYRILIAEAENTVTAFISLHVFHSIHSPGRIGRITAFCVHESFRSKGIGILLLNEAEKYFVAENCGKIEVTSNNRRTEAHQFYLNRGYLEDSRKFVRYLT